jgi:hypothetical protein
MRADLNCRQFPTRQSSLIDPENLSKQAEPPLSESTAGVRWHTRPGLYQVLDSRSAMRYEASLRGETDGRQPDLYGLRGTHRRSMGRKWLFVELSSSLFWAESADPALRCEACVGVAIGFEILFGDPAPGKSSGSCSRSARRAGSAPSTRMPTY